MVKVERVGGRGGEPLPLPAYQTLHASGLDLRADLEPGEQVILTSLERRLIPTGLKLELPAGYEAQVRPRSGLALQHGLTCLNSPGTIDADFRGEVQVLLVNLSQTPVKLARGERIAQLVVAPVTRASLVEVEALSESDRGSGGFGSTGRS